MENVKDKKSEIIDKNKEKLKDSEANESFENDDVNKRKILECVENCETSSKLDNSCLVENQNITETKNNQQNKCMLGNNRTDMLPDSQSKGEPSQKSLIHHSDCDENKTIDVKEENTQKRKIAVFEFDWALHIEEANKKQNNDNEVNKESEIASVPSHVFMHVEASLDGGVREGMIVEMPYQEQLGTTPEETREQFWLARVDGVYGPLLKLSYVGYKDIKREMWHDLTQKRLFPLGYCQMNKCHLKAPAKIQVESPDWEQLALQYLEDVTFDTLEMHHIEARNSGEGVTPIDRIRKGTVVEVQDEKNTNVFWPAIVSSNVGGLLGLTYVVDDGWKADEGFIPSSHVDLEPDITLFYLSTRVFPKGYAKLNKETTAYTPPSHILARNPRMDTKACVEWEDLAQGPPPDLLSRIHRDLEKVPKQTKDAFRTGGEIEIIHPSTSTTIERALILSSKEDIHFVVQLLSDDTDDCKLVVRNCLSSDILPCGWSESLKSVDLQPIVKDFKHKKVPRKFFHKFATENTKEFACNQKLEVRLRNGEFHCGTIIEIKDHILVIQLDSDNKNPQDLFLAPMDSLDIFPLGWTEINNLPLMLPPSFLKEDDEVKAKISEKGQKDPLGICPDNLDTTCDQMISWCPEIYFNYKCYSASFLSKARLASLPRCIGPGSVHLVMRKVISLLVGSSYKSGSILRRLKCHSDVPRKDFEIEEIKGKSRVLDLKENIEIPTRTYQVEKMCKEICQKVGACPNLVSMHRYLTDEGCPADCQNRPKSNFLQNEEDNAFAENPTNGNSQNGQYNTLISGTNTATGVTMKRRRDGRRKKRTNPDRLLIAEHIQLKRQKTRDQMSSEVGSSCEVSSGGSDMDGAETFSNSLASTAVSSRTVSRSNSPNSQHFTVQCDDIMNVKNRFVRKGKKGRGKKEWERLLPKSEMRTRGNKLPEFSLHFKMRHLKKELKNPVSSSSKNNKERHTIGLVSDILRPVLISSKPGLNSLKKRGRTRLELIPAFKLSDFPQQAQVGGSKQATEENILEEERKNRSSSSDNSEYEEYYGSSNEDISFYDEKFADHDGLPPIRNIRLSKNPEDWTVSDTVKFLAQTSDCAHLASFIREEAIDGQAFLLLNYPTVKEYWHLKTETAINLCQHIESVRLAHIMQFP